MALPSLGLEAWLHMINLAQLQPCQFALHAPVEGAAVDCNAALNGVLPALMGDAVERTAQPSRVCFGVEGLDEHIAHLQSAYVCTHG